MRSVHADIIGLSAVRQFRILNSSVTRTTHWHFRGLGVESCEGTCDLFVVSRLVRCRGDGRGHSTIGRFALCSVGIIVVVSCDCSGGVRCDHIVDATRSRSGALEDGVWSLAGCLVCKDVLIVSSG